MHGTFKNEDALPATKTQRVNGKARSGGAEARAARKEREESFRREFELAKATPVPLIGAPCKTFLC